MLLALMGGATAQEPKDSKSGPAAGSSTFETLILAKQHFALKQYSEAFPLFLKAAEAGNGEACTYLGAIYQNGLGGLAQDLAQAVGWYRKGGDRGNGNAMSALGAMYLSGAGGLPKDEGQALSWLRKAADAGDAGGMAADPATETPTESEPGAR